MCQKKVHFDSRENVHLSELNLKFLSLYVNSKACLSFQTTMNSVTLEWYNRLYLKSYTHTATYVCTIMYDVPWTTSSLHFLCIHCHSNLIIITISEYNIDTEYTSQCMGNFNFVMVHWIQRNEVCSSTRHVAAVDSSDSSWKCQSVLSLNKL